MRFSINIPNFGDFADAATVARVASAAEAAGWDALFVWDHVVHDKRSQRSFGDPWMLLTAAALATTRIKLGPMVTPVPRRRPQQLARQVSTLDNLSDGRVIFGAGLGGPIEDEYGSFGEPTDPRLLAERLDEGLDLLDRYWSGEAVTHDGRHYHVEDVTLLPTPVQRPRVPVWIGGFWPHRPPMRRAARWDGAIPLVPVRHARPPATRRRGPRPGRVRPWSSRRRPRPAIRARPGRGQPDQRRRRARPARSADRGRRHLVGRATAHRRRDQPARAGAPSHRGRSTDLRGVAFRLSQPPGHRSATGPGARPATPSTRTPRYWGSSP